jgi:hypothetical protein
VRLAAEAAQEMASGSPVETAALVASLRDFIRDVLELDPIPASLAIPKQGPLRSLGAREKAAGAASGSGGGGKGAGDGGGGGGGGMGGLSSTHHASTTADDEAEPH